MTVCTEALGILWGKRRKGNNLPRAAGVGRGKKSESKRGYIEGCCNAAVVLQGKKGSGGSKKVLAKKGLQGEVKKKGIGGEKKGSPRWGVTPPLLRLCTL